MGISPVFSQQEKELIDHILLLSRLFYGVTRLQMRKIAYEYAEKNSIKNNFNESAKLAGDGWLMQGFLKRSGDISLGKPEHTSIGRTSLDVSDKELLNESFLLGVLFLDFFLPAPVFFFLFKSFSISNVFIGVDVNMRDVPFFPVGQPFFITGMGEISTTLKSPMGSGTTGLPVLSPDGPGSGTGFPVSTAPSG